MTAIVYPPGLRSRFVEGISDRGPRMLEAEPEVTSAVDIFVKDLDLPERAEARGGDSVNRTEPGAARERDPGRPGPAPPPGSG
jgi:hypothetical protein